MFPNCGVQYNQSYSLNQKNLYTKYERRIFMKAYKNPTVEILSLAAEDLLASSGEINTIVPELDYSVYTNDTPLENLW